MPLISFVNRTWFEPDAIKRVAGELARLGIKRPLVCTDAGIVKVGILDRLREHWPSGMPWAVHDSTPPNPTEEAVLAALDRFRDGQCDGIVAIGGGSAIDLGKAVNLLSTHEGPLATYEIGRKGQGKIGAVGSLIAYVPAYLVVFGTSLFDAPWRDLALQAVVHGLLIAVISFVCIGRAVSILGASNGSAFAALAPAITALLAIPVLGEWPAATDWIAMLLISVGVYIASGAPLPLGVSPPSTTRS